MVNNKRKFPLRLVTDVSLTVLLLCLMAYQITGEVLHEWIGMAMTLLVIIHQVINRRWYAALFKGKYGAYRTVSTLVNVILVASFILTAFCGMAMSGYAVPFLYGMAPISFVRVTHLSMSHWSFVLMGLHLGLHVPVLLAKLNDKKRNMVYAGGAIGGGIGLYLFIRSGITEYLLFKAAFAFLDYDKPGWLTFIENILMLLFWVLVGSLCAIVLQKRKDTRKPA